MSRLCHDSFRRNISWLAVPHDMSDPAKSTRGTDLMISHIFRATKVTFIILGEY